MSSSRFLSAREARSNSRNSLLIFDEICGLQAAILNAVEAGKLDITVSDNTPITSINEIQSVTVLTGGTGYEPVQANVVINHPLGAGADLSAVVTNSVITSFIVNAGGTGYEPIQPTIDMSALGNGNAILTVVQNNGLITSINVVNPGTGYNIGDDVVIIHPQGSGAFAQVATLGGSGEIVSVVITNPGTGYDPVVATVTVTHPTGTSFVGTVQTNTGAVSAITITSGGIGYSDLVSTATITDPTGFGAVLQVNETLGVVTSVDVLNGGSAYNPSATITINPPQGSSASGATASLVIDQSQYSAFAPEYYAVFLNQVNDIVKKDQIDQVISYFVSLGYVIKLQINPSTNNTLQWYIQW